MSSKKINQLRADSLNITNKWLKAKKTLSKNPNNYLAKQRVENLMKKLEEIDDQILLEQRKLKKSSD